jgi:hypothetical protein
MYLRANPEHPNINGFGNESEDWRYTFNMTGSIAASGNIQYLLTSDGNRNDVPSSCYYGLFRNCTSLTRASLLPATTLAEGCYTNMFYGCSSLIQTPELPAETLIWGCYNNMFYGCTSLTNAYFPNLDSNTVINEVVGEQ